jgi:DNA-binding IclR family transcriptional regulator
MFDGMGFVHGAKNKGERLAGRRVALFGAGGAGSAIACGLAEAGVESIAVIDQAPGKAEALAGKLNRAFPQCAVSAAREISAGIDMVVNASPVGMKPYDGLPALSDASIQARWSATSSSCRALADDPARDRVRLPLRRRPRDDGWTGRRAARVSSPMSHSPADRCLAIVELLAARAGEMPLGEIAEQLALPKSGTHRLLATLIDRGWAEKDPVTSFYRLTMRLAVLGQQFFVATGIPDVWQPILDRFAQRCHEFARLAVVDGHSLVWVAHAQGASGGLMYQPSLTSNTVPLHATASGKAWLATLSADRALQLVTKNGGLKDAGQYGPNVVRSVDALLREIRATARRWLRARVQRGGVRRQRRRSRHSGRRWRTGARHPQHRRPQRPHHRETGA